MICQRRAVVFDQPDGWIFRIQQLPRALQHRGLGPFDVTFDEGDGAGTARAQFRRESVQSGDGDPFLTELAAQRRMIDGLLLGVRTGGGRNVA